MSDCVNTRLTQGLVRKIEENSSYQTINERVALATSLLTVWLREFPEIFLTEPSVIHVLTQSRID